MIGDNRVIVSPPLPVSAVDEITRPLDVHTSVRAA